MSTRRSSEKAFPEEEPEFQVAPMIDILLVLMTFFMSITSTEVIKTQPKIENFVLPVAKDSKLAETARSQVTVNVGWNPLNKGHEGVIDLDGIMYKDPTDIVQNVEQRKRGQPTLRALIRVSEEVPYSFVREVMAACAAADVDNITFAVLAKDIPKEYSKAMHPDK